MSSISAHGLEGSIPEQDIEDRLRAVLEVRDANLRASQEALVGSELELLVDEPPNAEGQVVGRAEMDAPEVDLLTRVHAPTARVGERLTVRVTSVADSLDLIADVVD